MDKAKVLDMDRQYALAVKTHYDCKQVFLYDSYVKGTPHEESDIDIAVILKEYENPMDIQLDLMRLRRTIDSRIEPHPFREKDFNITNPIVDEILKHGQRIDSSIL